MPSVMVHVDEDSLGKCEGASILESFHAPSPHWEAASYFRCEQIGRKSLPRVVLKKESFSVALYSFLFLLSLRFVQLTSFDSIH